MPSAGAKLGLKAVVYINTATFGSPTWSAVNSVSDLKLSAKWDEAEAATRESRVKLALKTMFGLEVSGKLRDSNSGDTNFLTVIAALLTDAQLDMMILDGGMAVNGVKGFRMAWQVFQGDQDQGLGAVIQNEVSFKPTPNADGNYSTVLVTTGAPVFLAI